MHKSTLSAKEEVNQAAVDDFKIQDDVKMYIQLHEYDDSQCFDLGDREELPTVPKHIYGGAPKTIEPNT